MKAGGERGSICVWTKWLIFSGSSTSIQILFYYSANIHTSCFIRSSMAYISMCMWIYHIHMTICGRTVQATSWKRDPRAQAECHKTWAIKHTDIVQQSAFKAEQQTINEKCIGWQLLSATSEIIASMFTKLWAYSTTIWKVSMKLNSLNKLIISNSSTTSCKSQSEESSPGWEGISIRHGLSPWLFLCRRPVPSGLCRLWWL